MEGVICLLLSLLVVQTIAGPDHPHNVVRDAEDMLIHELTHWGSPKTVARDEVGSGEWNYMNALESELGLHLEKSSKVRRTETVEEGTCGTPAILPSTNVRVVGGVEAVPHSWPWMVSLQADGNHFCGGSLINNQWVVSAAHCHSGFKTSVGIRESVAVVGQHRRSQPDSYTVRVPVSKVLINGKYDRPGRLMTSDIMLLKLAHPVEFNDAVSPVCLPSLFQVLPMGTRCYSSGWGTLRTGGLQPDELMQVMLPILDNEVCNQPGWFNNTWNGYEMKLDDSMVCAGYQEGGLGNCHGDSGGPLVCRDGDHWILYGVVSWGSMHGCAITNGPTVYARASAYINWISETIRANSD